MSVINTNITALIGQNNLSKSQSMLAKAQERLSSGLRINSAADDAAGQAIANKMTAQIRGMEQASRNASDGISLVQTMEGGLDQINDNLQRIRELAVQGANDTNAQEDRDAIVTEINERLAEIDRVAGSNNFNGTNLLNVSGGGTLNIQVGSNTEDEDVITVERLDATVEGLDLNGITEITDSVFAITSGGGAGVVHDQFQALVDAVDTATESLDTNRATLGATLNRFDSVIENLATTSTNLSEARSRIEDADYAVEVSNMTRANILQQAGTSMLAQANQTPQSVLSLLG
ncbi:MULTISPECIES: flagellin N-terminal helical domain-containing protein [unclassified Halomonas]|uniref:flagellin N-terminal helical domain-containing protein n=1 Tax=unclassified Halomonas TaxID=2609666 RepID=UPI0009906E41|nr:MULTISPECIES: flagellin [unclassified Halomonas]AQU84852.1 flagellin [Halomonas sp. 'Soap Lake \